MSVKAENRPGVNLQVLQHRADKFRVPVGQFQLSRDDRNMAYGSETAPDVIHDTEVGLLVKALGPTAFVQKAEARLPGGRLVQLDFRTLTASGRIAARYPIREILLPALALLWKVAQDDHAEVDKFLPFTFEESPQTRLQFDMARGRG